MERIAVLDSGGQYCHLIARKVRELGVYAEIRPVGTTAARLSNCRGVILSGGPASVFEPGSPQPDPALFRLSVPLLGICYGHQLMARHLDGGVAPGVTREFGPAMMTVESGGSIFKGLGRREQVWMNHGDHVAELPPGFRAMARTRDCAIAAMGDERRRFYGLQFHPEVTHTRRGVEILRNFLFRVCGCRGDWRPEGQVRQITGAIRRRADGRRVLFFLSGGVDSTVAYSLTVQALGAGRVHGIYVNTGFMREGETAEIAEAFAPLGLGEPEVIDARRRFFPALRGVTDPERKRQIIGRLFVEVQDHVLSSRRYSSRQWMLGQGTIYPDTIESGGTQHAAVIKTHHNRVDRIRQLMVQKRVLEPLAQFYKDEVRHLGRVMGLPDQILRRHPFPGPGLAIRCLCSDRRRPLEADAEVEALALEAGYRAFLLPLRSVGIQGDSRTYAQLTVLYGSPIRHEALAGLTTRITNRFRRTNRVAVVVRPSRFEPEEWRIHRATLTPRRIRLLQRADQVVTRFLRDQFLYDLIWQCPVVLLPFSRSGGETIALRPISSVDGMTAEVVHIPAPQLEELASRLAQIDGIDAVLFDISSKPPSTIEWE